MQSQLSNRNAALQWGTKRHPQLAVARKPQNWRGGLHVCVRERQAEERERVCLCVTTGTWMLAWSGRTGVHTHTRQRSIGVLRDGAHHGAERSSCSPSEKVGAGLCLVDGFPRTLVKSVCPCIWMLAAVIHSNPHVWLSCRIAWTFLALIVSRLLLLCRAVSLGSLADLFLVWLKVTVRFMEFKLCAEERLVSLL